MKKRYLLLALSIMSVFLFAACGSKMPKELKAEDVAEDTLYIKADGMNQIAYVSDFKENYYNEEELKSFIYKELEFYNNKFGEGTAELTDFISKNKMVKAIITFKNNKAYADFSKKKSDTPISFPSFSKLMEEYEELDFFSSKDGESKKGKDAIDREKDNVAIVSGPILFQTEKKILYYSTGKLIDENHLKLEEKEEAVVVFKR